MSQRLFWSFSSSLFVDRIPWEKWKEIYIFSYMYDVAYVCVFMYIFMCVFLEYVLSFRSFSKQWKETYVYAVTSMYANLSQNFFWSYGPSSYICETYISYITYITYIWNIYYIYLWVKIVIIFLLVMTYIFVSVCLSLCIFQIFIHVKRVR